MLDVKWNEFWTGKANPVGGFMMKISCPKGNYFASSHFNDSVNENFHFRGASTTKPLPELQSCCFINKENLILMM